MRAARTRRPAVLGVIRAATLGLRSNNIAEDSGTGELGKVNWRVLVLYRRPEKFEVDGEIWGTRRLSVC